MSVLYYLNTTYSYDHIAIKDIFSDYEIDKVQHICRSLPMEEALVLQDSIAEEKKLSQDKIVNSVRDSHVGFLHKSENEWIYKKLSDAVRFVNSEFYKYDLQCIEPLQYAKYNRGQFYTTHMDMEPIGAGTVRKLSFSMLLSEPRNVKGGDLTFHLTNDPIVPVHERGTVIFFPSFVPHSVQPVVEGVRESLVGWVRGPALK